MRNDAVVHVIDDDQAVRDSLSFLLKSAGFAVDTYESATSFLHQLSEVTTGCVITDVRMPDLSGIDLLNRLKEMRVRLPVIVITGHADVPLAVQAMKSGALEFFEKPFDDEILLAAVKAALQHQGADAKRDADRAQSSTGWRAFPTGNGRCSRALLPVTRTRPLRSTTESARAPWRFIAQT